MKPASLALRGSSSVAALLVLTSLLAAAPVHAKDPGADPEALIRIGNDLRRHGEDRRAEGYFRRAYDIAPTPRSAAQLGLLELALSRFAQAEALLSEALASQDAWVLDHRAVLETSRANARAHLAGVELLGVPRDATLISPDGAVTKIPADAVVWVEPGAIHLKVQAIGHKLGEVSLTAPAGETRKVEVAMPLVDATPAPAPAPSLVTPPTAGEPTTPAPEAPPATPGRGQRIAGIVVGAAGLAAAITGVVLLEKGNAEVDATNKAARTPGGVYDPGNGSFETLQNLGVGLIVGGATAAVVGGTLFYLGLRHGEAPAVSLNLGVGRGVLQWEGAF
jgi:hypothetical protein